MIQKIELVWIVVLSRKNTKAMPVIARDADTLRAQAHLFFHDKIIRGDYRPSARIKERELIEKLGVSGTITREAIRQLETKRLITVEPQVGPTVRIMSATKANEFYLMHATLKKLANSLFIKNQSGAGIKKLQNTFNKLITSFRGQKPDAIIKQKNKFFEIIYYYAGHHVLASLIDSLIGQSRRWRSIGLNHPNRDPKRQQRSLNNLSHLYKAIFGKDVPRAQKIIDIEVQDAQNEILRLIKVDAGEQ